MDYVYGEIGLRLWGMAYTHGRRPCLWLWISSAAGAASLRLWAVFTPRRPFARKYCPLEICCSLLKIRCGTENLLFWDDGLHLWDSAGSGIGFSP